MEDNAEWTGTDCIGFAQRAASYNNNPYSWPNYSNGFASTGTNASSIPRHYPYINGNYGIMISKKVNFGRPSNLKHIKPGDVFYYLTENKSKGAHIAIVSSIEFDKNGELNLNNIKLIEATFESDEKYDGTFCNVISFRNVNDYDKKIRPKRDWYIVRLK